MMMVFTEKQVSDWRKYEKVREGGRYNMIADPRARKATGLDRDEFVFCIKHYEDLREVANA